MDTNKKLVEEVRSLRSRLDRFKREMCECESSRGNIKRLNLILRTMHHVNLLITRENERRKLLKGVCENLIRNRGYYNAWIVLLDESGKFLMGEEAGLGADFELILEKLRSGELTECGHRTLSEGGVVCIDDPVSACVDCPLSERYAAREGMTVRLEYGGKVYGFMSVSIPSGLVTDKQEQELFEEVSTDIAYALHSIEEQEKRLETEKKLQKSQGRFRELFEAATDVILMIDLSGNIVEINPYGAKLTGYTREELLGKNVLRDLIIPDDREQMVEVFKNLMAGKSRIYEVHWRAKSGEIIYLEAHSTCKRLDSSDFICCILRNITEFKKAEEELNKFQRQIVRTELLASLGTLSATLAHELIQPMTAVRFAIENSLDELNKTTCPDTVLEDLNDSLSELSNAVSIMDRFRGFARKSSNKVIDRVDLHSTAGKVAGLLKKSAQKSNIAIDIEQIKSLPSIENNQNDIEQIFFAIMQNSVQAVNGSKYRHLKVSGFEEGGFVELRFADNCGGIEQENLSRLFEPFFTTKVPNQGTGLGLCVVQDLVFSHGGKVRVESDFGMGTTFYITLPKESKLRKL